MAVTDYGFELEGVPFGIGQLITVENEGFDPGSAEWLTQDQPNPRDGSTMFGRDKLTGPTWIWQLSTDCYGTPEEAAELGIDLDAHPTDRHAEVTALRAASRLASAWRSQRFRDKPGVVVPMKYRVGNRTRRVYGRPRTFAAPPSNRMSGGYVPITADFKCVDHLHYDDVASSATIGLPVGGDGVRIPARFPVRLSPAVQQPGQIQVGGDAYTYPVIRIDGPVSNPWVEGQVEVGQDWRIDLNMTIVAGDYVEIDTHPWVNTILRNDTANVSDALGRRQWLSKVRLKPGDQNITFGGSAVTGSPSVTVTWRAAWSYL